jgi:hypothetical protein
MGATEIIILGVMGPLIFLCIIGIIYGLRLNKKEREEAERAAKEEKAVASSGIL